MRQGYRHATAGLVALLLTASGVWAGTPAAPQEQIDVGIFTAVEGKVVVTHPGLQKPIPAKLQDGVLFKDVIETEKESRTKALLNDDSILTVGEHSRVEITEHIYDPNQGVRSVVINLVKGQVRALVGKVFHGSGSKFEIHTPTAVAAARGTYFVVFHINGVSGIANVGTHGHVDFSSGGRTVNVPPGQFSVTPPGGGSPSTPTVNTTNNAPSQVTNSVKGTEVKDNPKNESPKQTAMAAGGTAPVSSPSSLTPPGVSGGGETTSSSSSSSSSSRNTTASTGFGLQTTTSTTVVSVPAVISGAAISQPQPLAEPLPTPAESPPAPIDPQLIPTPTEFQSLENWFVKKVSDFTELFTKQADTVELQEALTVARAYDKALKSADETEAKAINLALLDEQKTIKEFKDNYEKTIEKINSMKLSDNEIVQLKLKAQLDYDDGVRKAHNRMLYLSDEARGNRNWQYKLALSIYTAQQRELNKLQRADRKNPNVYKGIAPSYLTKVTEVTERYARKLIAAGVDQESDFFKLKVAAFQADAIKLAQETVNTRLAGIRADDIARRAALPFLNDEFLRIEKHQKKVADHANVNRQNQLVERYQHEREYTNRKK